MHNNIDKDNHVFWEMYQVQKKDSLQKSLMAKPAFSFFIIIAMLAGIVLAVERQGENINGKIEIQDQNQPPLQQSAAPEASSAQAVILNVKSITITGNELISNETLFANVPDTFSTPGSAMQTTPGPVSYDFTDLKAVIATPGTEKKISAHNVQGFTQYILDQYKKKHWAGIYVFVPSQAMVNGQLVDGVLPIQIIEGKVADVNVRYLDEQQKEKAKGYLNPRALLGWSPIKIGETINQKKLDEYTNTLNQNPDRHVSPIVSAGAAPGSLDVNYDVYEVSPWHTFAQVDNSGTKNNRWLPRIGIINTNLLGYDDIATVIYQAHAESDFDENYALYGSYDIPVFNPRLRFKAFGGYSQFDSTPAGGSVNFLGRGNFYGGELRYNLFQYEKWFFDIFGSLSRENSKVANSIFSELNSDVDMDMLGYGLELHKRDRMSEVSLGWEAEDMIGGSDRADFALARTGAEPDFQIYTARAYVSQYLDSKYRIQRVSSTLKWIDATDRLVPAKMTSFGGMYSIRGYEEFDTLADQGVLASAQYEFDLVKYDKAANGEKEYDADKPRRLRKLAPVAFVDYGEADIIDHRANEDNKSTLVSVGPGLLAEVGEHISGAIYYGIPLKATPDTDKGDGRVNVSLLVRW